MKTKMSLQFITLDNDGHLSFETVRLPVSYTRYYRLAGLSDEPTDAELDAAIESCTKKYLYDALIEAREYRKKIKEDE